MASSTPQPGSWRWLQLWKRQWPSVAAKSGINGASCSGAIWRRPNSWKPGESIRAPLRASSSQYQRVLVVVWRPVFSACEISPTCAAACGTTRLISVLLPMPLGPSTSVVRPASSGASVASDAAGSRFSASSTTGVPIAR